MFYTLSKEAIDNFEIDEKYLTFNSFTVSIDIYIKYLSKAIVTLYPVNLLNHQTGQHYKTNINNNVIVIDDDNKGREDEEDLEATLVNKKRSFDNTTTQYGDKFYDNDINIGNSSLLKKMKIENYLEMQIDNNNSVNESEIKQKLEELYHYKSKPPLLRVINNIFNVNYLSVHNLPFSKICGQGQLLFMRENEEKDQYLYIFSNDFALKTASQSSYFDLGKIYLLKNI